MNAVKVDALQSSGLPEEDPMNRRQFLKTSAAGVAASMLGGYVAYAADEKPSFCSRWNFTLVCFTSIAPVPQ